MAGKMTQEEEIKIMKELEAFDTPSITNAIATYPSMNECLGLYDPQKVNWYTDNRLRCLYPELGPRCGYAVTAVYGMLDPAFGRLEFKDILVEIAEAEGVSAKNVFKSVMAGKKKISKIFEKGGNK